MLPEGQSSDQCEFRIKRATLRPYKQISNDLAASAKPRINSIAMRSSRFAAPGRLRNLRGISLAGLMLVLQFRLLQKSKASLRNSCRVKPVFQC